MKGTHFFQPQYRETAQFSQSIRYREELHADIGDRPYVQPELHRKTSGTTLNDQQCQARFRLRSGY
jgi:hypothetical protein